MKVLFDHGLPFLLAHGGFQRQIDQTRNALLASGVEVDYLRWWDDTQGGHLIHYFGRPPSGYIALAHQKSLKVVFTALHSSLGVRAAWKRRAHRFIVDALPRLSRDFAASFAWDSYRQADACITVTAWEAQLVRDIFQPPPERLHVVPNGIEECFLQPASQPRGPWLVTTASILPVKRILESAAAAVAGQVPYWVIGKPFSETDPYYLQFRELCRAHPSYLRYEGPVTDRTELAEIYRSARGFVLLSHWESLSLSALEAVASGCPMFLSDLPWARIVFGSHATYCPPRASAEQRARLLKQFYDQAPSLQPSFRPLSWNEVGRQLSGIYQTILASG